MTGETIEGDGESEICIRGHAVTVGMYEREREEVFDEDGWYRTAVASLGARASCTSPAGPPR